MAFLKALELARDNHKINFYLGSVYERMQRYPDAIYQYRQAGAHLMVRRVEDKMAAGGAASPPRPRVKSKKDDTAEFKASEIREALNRTPETRPPESPAGDRTEETLPPHKGLQPLSPAVLAEHAQGRMGTDTARFSTGSAVRRSPDVIAFPQPAVPGREAPAGGRRETFHMLENNLLEVDFSGKVFIKQGTIYSYGGNLTFWVKDRRPGGQPALVIITGTGKVILTDKDREITFINVEDGIIFVEPGHLLACEATLTPRYISLEGAGAVEFLAVEGRGVAALSVGSRPLPLVVTPDLPVSVPAGSIVSWSGQLRPTVVDDRQIYEIMLPPGSQAGPLIRLEGNGRVLVEHGK
jgi:uncharacterized protein (AIM24 family)